MCFLVIDISGRSFFPLPTVILLGGIGQYIVHCLHCLNVFLAHFNKGTDHASKRPGYLNRLSVSRERRH